MKNIKNLLATITLFSVLVLGAVTAKAGDSSSAPSFDPNGGIIVTLFKGIIVTFTGGIIVT